MLILFTFVSTIYIVMKERLLEFLKSENKSSAQLAEEIGVQASGISHILSGRNNPSLDFVLKMLEKYHFLSTDWLLFGKGSMYKDTKMQSLFDEFGNSDPETSAGTAKMDFEDRKAEEKLTEREIAKKDLPAVDSKRKSAVARIVFFYADNSFEEYTPREEIS
jgi:transcriptional regulator with XRE-family HTH domain